MVVMEVRGDFHIHTIYSYDATISPRTLIKEALRKELKVLAVTDHNTFRGSIEVRRLARGFEDLIVIHGIEWKTDCGEVILLCHEPLEVISKNLEEAVENARSNGCIVIAPHPFDEWRSGIGDRVFDIKLDGIEVFNPWSPIRSNKAALKAAKILNVTKVANSDAHTIENLDLAYNVLYLKDFNEEAVFKCLLSGDVKPSGRYPSISSRFKTKSKKVLKRLGLYSGRTSVEERF